MRFVICEDYEQLSRVAADFVASMVILKPDCNLGMATGSTPIGMFLKLVEKGLDFSEVTTFNLDEYYPIRRDNPQSYYTFMTEHLYSKVNLKPENIHIPNGETENPAKECQQYDRLIEHSGGLDLQILGVGHNGHIGFNEPGAYLQAFTHVTQLTRKTIEANSRFFDCIEDVPTQAITMGVATIMKAKRIMLLASGVEKAPVIRALKSGIIDPQITATILAAHSDVTVVVDKAAASQLGA